MCSGPWNCGRSGRSRPSSTAARWTSALVTVAPGYVLRTAGAVVDVRDHARLDPLIAAAGDTTRPPAERAPVLPSGTS
ncbi:hypothetical protein [Pseudonocardia humida]|uniref:Uncharacterized protein n=1 Tax=Pseudonocardia humida TaxID=2800819 RepID=A0ABT1A6U7_9PSEU|nr:hypothetical protein [Pseudonocardia humida]MCO1658740.1 hypothetical protein [Pseudonocardia humida]